MNEHLKILHDFNNQKNSIQDQLRCGIISSTDATNEVNLINRKEFIIKEALVLEKHIGKGGKPRTISFIESKQLYCTKLADGSKMYGKTREALITKLFEFYELTISDYSIKGIFNVAIDEKARTENVQLRTIERIKSDYNYSISEDFSCRDIRTITKADLKEYTQSMVKRLKPTDKRFKAYKSVLNIIFRYALEYEIISVNPVDSIKNAVYKKDCKVEVHDSADNILSLDDIETVKAEVEKRMLADRYNGYFVNGFIILLAIETGMRVGELCALKWCDISTDIHIHAQQLFETRDGVKTFYYADWTKDEKGISKGGRHFPLTDAISDILKRLALIQNSKGIHSEYVFCDEDGEWIKSNRYTACLQRLMKSLGHDVTNNHAFRKSLNSNVFIPLGIPVTDRAKLLGHSVETNLRHYSYARLGVENDLKTLLNQQVTPRSPQNVVNFLDFTKEKSPTNREFVGLSYK